MSGCGLPAVCSSVLGQAAWPLWATVFLPVQCWSGQHIFHEVGVSIERAMYEPGV